MRRGMRLSGLGCLASQASSQFSRKAETYRGPVTQGHLAVYGGADICHPGLQV